MGTVMPSRTSKNERSITEGLSDFKFLVEQFADLKVMRYKVPGFEGLTLEQKELVYYLNTMNRMFRLDTLFTMIEITMKYCPISV